MDFIKERCCSCGELCNEKGETSEIRYECRGNFCLKCSGKAYKNYIKRVAKVNEPQHDELPQYAIDGLARKTRHEVQGD